MTKPKLNASVAKRESGFLSCTVCKLVIPFAGHNDQEEGERPKHRCLRERGVQPFNRFSFKPPSKQAIARRLPE